MSSTVTRPRTSLPVAALGLLLAGCPAWLEEEPAHIVVVVERGDTLWGLAKRHGVEVAELRTWNGLEGDTLEVGQELRIYTEGGPEAAPGPATSGRRGRRARSGGGSAPEAAGTAGSPTAGLSLPPERACLAGPDAAALGEGDEPEVSASRGLSHAQVSAAMRAFVHHTLRCVPEGTQPAGTVELHLTVACTGRVARVEVLDDGGMPPELVACVPEVLAYAPFPAHDLPDGETFRYPLRFSWD